MTRWGTACVGLLLGAIAACTQGLEEAEDVKKSTFAAGPPPSPPPPEAPAGSGARVQSMYEGEESLGFPVYPHDPPSNNPGVDMTVGVKAAVGKVGGRDGL